VTPLETLLAQRSAAAARGDLNLVHEVTLMLERAGWTDTESRAPERVVPNKPKRRG
jgi:hypothetical protein